MNYLKLQNIANWLNKEKGWLDMVKKKDKKQAEADKLTGYEPEFVMNRDKIAGSIHQVLDSGTEMLHKNELDDNDYGKMKVIKTINPALKNGVEMIRTETAQQRNMINVEKMKSLGYQVESIK